MGMIQITFMGSFSRDEKKFSAMSSGHAVALDDAIAWLESKREAIAKQDNDLRSRNRAPQDEFSEADRRGLLRFGPKEGT
jgi:hypothetical protein